MVVMGTPGCEVEWSGVNCVPANPDEADAAAWGSRYESARSHPRGRVHQPTAGLLCR